MADLAWSIDHDARDPGRVAALVSDTCAPLASGCVRPLVAMRRAGKTWALRAIEHATRASHRPSFLDLRSVTELPILDGTSNLLLLDEPSPWLVDPERAATLLAWIDDCHRTAHLILALTPAELARLRGFAHGLRQCAARSELYLPRPHDDELQRAAASVALSQVPWRWRSSFYLLRTWLDALAQVSTTSSDVATIAHRLLRVGVGDAHAPALFGESLTPALQTAVIAIGGGEAVDAPSREALVALGLVREHGADGPWQIADPVLAARLTPLRIHHVSDVHVGDKAAATVDAKQDPTTDGRMTAAIGNTFVRDEYVTHLRQLTNQGLGPHLVVVSGDLVERAGDAALIEAARDWVDQVRALVGRNEHACLHDHEPRVLLVGGNHDVDWGKARDPDRYARHRPFAAAFADLPHPCLEQPLATRPCAPVLYRDAKVAFWLLGSAELGGEQLEDLRFRAVFEFAEKLVEGSDDFVRMALEAHRPKLERIDPGLVAQGALDAAEPPPAIPVRIAVLHHPVTSLSGTAPEIASFTGLINAATVKATLRQKGYQLVLHGHLHHGALVTEISHDSDRVRELHIAAAPSLGSKEVQEQHGYNAITLARALPVAGQVDQVRVRVERHLFSGKGAGWKPDGAALSFDVPV